MRHPRISLVAMPLVMFLALPGAGHAASFDCSKASSRLEKLICADPELSTLDEHLARYYRAARTVLGRGGECLKTEQREWLANVRGSCSDADCLRRAYLARLTELDGLQPGATAIQNMELPPGRQMLGILAPAADEVAAPRTSASAPVEISGRIVDEVESGDGFVLRDAAGKSYLLRPLMFIEPEDATMLASATRQPEAEYSVRGFLDTGEQSFDVSQCAYIYRLPAAGH